MLQPIYIIGKGNLGWHLQELFKSKNFKNVQWVSSRESFEHNLKKESLIFLTVSDDFIENSIIKLISINPNQQIIYCSGSLDLVSKYSNNLVCWYPLYSFNKEIAVDWNSIPVFTEIQDSHLELMVNNLNADLNIKTICITAAERAKLHLAAVFINNYTTACAIASNTILKDSNHFKYLIPIFIQTVQKISEHNSDDLTILQTGPAKRGDKMVISKHLSLLKTLAPEKELYSAILEYIQQKFIK